MNPLLVDLEQSYARRCVSDSDKSSAWAETAREFPPHLSPYPEQGLLPSTLFALTAGDMGLALVWIVQHALVHSLLKELSADPRQEGAGRLSSAIRGDQIGALAHSEDPAFPAVITQKEGHIALEGVKKYITGGMQCDFILLTAREINEEKISHLVFVPRAALPDGALTELDLPLLKTAGHAALRTDGITLSPEHLLCRNGSLIRRLIKKWGIVERALILEAYIALCLYLVNTMKNLSLPGLPDESFVEALFEEQKTIASGLLRESRESPMPSPPGVGISAAVETAKAIEKAAGSAPGPLPDSLLFRVKDLGLYRLFS